MKIENLEFREIQSYGSKIPYNYYEIVEWRKDSRFNESGQYCFTVVSWTKGSEGWDLKFCGDRPFDNSVDTEQLWELMRYGNTVANAAFRLEEYINE